MKNKLLPPHVSQWRGYTLEEIRYEKLVTLTCMEIEKTRIIDLAEKTRNELPFIGQSDQTSWLGNFAKFEYIVTIYKLYRKISTLFKKKK